MSSEEAGFGLLVAEKFFGLILLVVGSLATYFAFTSGPALKDYTGFFGFLSLIILGIGLLLIFARIE